MEHNLIPKIKCYYDNLNIQKKRAFLRTLEEMLFYKEKLELNLKFIDVNQGLNLCGRYIFVIDENRNEMFIEEIVYFLEKNNAETLSDIIKYIQ